MGVSCACAASELAQLPQGYTWYEDQGLEVAVPVPKGWYIKKDQSRGTSALFITKENIDAVGQFATGYTLNFIDGFSSRGSGGPTKYATAFILKTQQAAKSIVLEPWVINLAPGVTAVGIRCRDEDRVPTLVHYFLIADESRDSLRIMTFEAPEATWRSAWQHGELMLSRGVILPEDSKSGTTPELPASARKP